VEIHSKVLEFSIMPIPVEGAYVKIDYLLELHQQVVKIVYRF
jgi:hypothetical protein